jgi:hypothetical protein
MPTVGWRFNVVSSMYVYFYQDFPNVYPYFTAYMINNSYINALNLCYPTYYLVSPQLCVKNFTNPIQFNGSNNVNVTNEVIPEIIIGKTLSFSTFSLIPKFIRSLFLFLDDLFYYKYHRVQYP